MHVISLPESAVQRGRLMGLDKPIDPATTAVIAVDFQRFFIDDGQPMGNRHARDVLANANRINAAVRNAGGLVVHTQHSVAPPTPSGRDDEPGAPDLSAVQELRPGSPSFDIHPDIVRAGDDVSIVKYRSSPLHPQAGTGLMEILRARGIETLVVTGLASNGCCDCLARDAFQHGFNVVVASDASAAMTDEEHNASLLNLAIYYAQVLHTDTIESALAVKTGAPTAEPLRRDYHHDYDLGDPELNERWDDVVADLHQGCPVARSEVGEGYWVVNRYEDVVRCAKDWQTFSAASGFMVNRPEGLPYFAPGESDPPLHAQLRATLDPYLRPTVVRALEPAIRATADALIDTFIADGETDVVATFANPLPQAVFSVQLAGMDPADMPYLLKTFSLSGPIKERGANFAAGMAKIEEYLRQRSEEPPRGDIVDALLAFTHDGYGWLDRVGTMSQLTIGGIGTTGFVFAGGLHHLATHAQDRQLLVEDPSRINRAVDEFLRLFMGAPNMARRATTDVTVGGVRIRAGDRVLMSFGAASRDPAVCERPNEVDIARRQVRHLAFGSGGHRCIGASLARPILKIGFERFLARIPDFAVPEAFEPTYETGNTRHMLELPLYFTPAPALATAPAGPEPSTTAPAGASV